MCKHPPANHARPVIQFNPFNESLVALSFNPKVKKAMKIQKRLTKIIQQMIYKRKKTMKTMNKSLTQRIQKKTKIQKTLQTNIPYYPLSVE